MTKKIYKQSLKTKVYKIKGFDCASCATLLEIDLNDLGLNCKCSYSKGELEIEGEHDPKKVIEVVKKSGYSIT